MKCSESPGQSFDMQTVEVPWPGEGGPWRVMVDLARIDGNRRVVGLHIVSYTTVEDSDGVERWIPLPGGPSEVTHAVIRGVRIGQISEFARRVADASGEVLR